MTYTEAFDVLTEVLQKLVPSGLQVNIYAWPARPATGVRIAEISFSNSNGGYSFMQSDIPYGLAVCAQAERALIGLMENWDADGGTDGAEEIERLEFLLREGKA